MKFSREWLQERSEILISVVLLLLLATCIDPLTGFMPDVWDDLVVVLIIAAFGLYAGAIYRERTRDEREQLHLARAERGGFLTGTALLVLSIVLDALGRPMDKALIWVLGGMILAKLILLFIERIRN